MAQVVSELPLTLESSTQLTRPDARLLTNMDANTGETSITEYTLQRSRTQMNLPCTSGPRDYHVSCCDQQVQRRLSSASPTKKRIEFSVLDPITGFLSPAGENLLRVQGRMPSLGKARLEPQHLVPQSAHTIRTQPEAIDELKRSHEGDADPELKWNSQKVNDNALKSRLGGWTSLYDPREVSQAKNENPYRLKDIYPNMKIAVPDDKERDELAKRYRFTTSTQEMYRQVNWDSKLPSRLHAPTTTYEGGRADPLKRIEPSHITKEIAMKLVGSKWGREQYRHTYATRDPVVFTAPTKRAQQIPGYSGYLSANGIQMDDVCEDYKPAVVVRTKQPKEPNNHYNPNIPGYTGRYHYTKTTHVSHYDNQGRPFTTTAAFQRPNAEAYDSAEPKAPSVTSDLARIVTKVPPHNPHDSVERFADRDVNNSIDHVKYPIVNPKNTTHQDYSIRNYREPTEIKSILKKTTNNE